MKLHPIGYKTGKLELISNTETVYTFLCTCGSIMTKPIGLVHRSLPPVQCSDCIKASRVSAGCGNLTIRPYTPEEKKMIRLYNARTSK